MEAALPWRLGALIMLEGANASAPAAKKARTTNFLIIGTDAPLSLSWTHSSGTPKFRDLFSTQNKSFQFEKIAELCVVLVQVWTHTQTYRETYRVVGRIVVESGELERVGWGVVENMGLTEEVSVCFPEMELEIIDTLVTRFVLLGGSVNAWDPIDFFNPFCKQLRLRCNGVLLIRVHICGASCRAG
jgi:hypothetical protein